MAACMIIYLLDSGGLLFLAGGLLLAALALTGMGLALRRERA